MILGIDIGNYATKSSEMISFTSKCSKVCNLFGNGTVLERHSEKHFIEEGNFDTEYQKVKKQNYIEFMLTAIALSSNSIDNKVVVGLPIGQFKKDKDELKDLILNNRINKVKINKCERKIIIEDCEVSVEGIAAAPESFEGIIIDIGGRTTDIALIMNKSGRRKIVNPFSLPQGTLNLYSDYTKAINSKYSLDLKLEDAQRILKNGLKIYGIEKDVSFAIDIFKEFVEQLVRTLQVEYSIKTLDVLCTGGGSQLLYKPLKNRIPQLEIISNAFFANAIGYKKVGEQLWLN